MDILFVGHVRSLDFLTESYFCATFIQGSNKNVNFSVNFAFNTYGKEGFDTLLHVYRKIITETVALANSTN